jgi:hypothetical protein
MPIVSIPYIGVKKNKICTERVGPGKSAESLTHRIPPQRIARRDQNLSDEGCYFGTQFSNSSEHPDTKFAILLRILPGRLY